MNGRAIPGAEMNTFRLKNVIPERIIFVRRGITVNRGSEITFFWSFVKDCYFLLELRMSYSTLENGGSKLPETSLLYYQSTQQHIPEERSLQNTYLITQTNKIFTFSHLYRASCYRVSLSFYLRIAIWNNKMLRICKKVAVTSSSVKRLYLFQRL